MARRRDLGAGGERDMDGNFDMGSFYDEGGAIQGLNPGDGDFGWSNSLSPEELQGIEQNLSGGVFDNPIAGSPQGPRDIFGTQAPRTSVPKAPPSTPALPPPPTVSTASTDPGPSAPDINALIGMLPQGVEAFAQPDASTPAQGIESFGAGSQSAPMQSSAPQSVSMAATPPANANSVGPRRQSVSSPVNLISGGRTGGGLIGRAGGLTQGGIGMPGGPSGGPTATKQMLELLKQLNGGQ